MNVFGIEGMWNLTWIIPVVFWIGVFAACYWPYGKGPQGPPYVGFDPGDNYTGRHRFDAKPLVDVRMFGEPPHPDRQCGPACWAYPDGHRRSH